MVTEPEMIKCAVVILNWNGLEWLRKFLGTVVKYSSGPDTAIYVADNGSTDGSAKWVRENFREVKLILMEKNNGFAGGYNIALDQINAVYYILLNSDVEITQHWLDPLISFMDSNRDVAACQPKIKSYYRRDSFEYAGAAGGFIDKFGYTFCRGRIFDKVEKDDGQYDDQTDIFWASGACMAVRADAWKKCLGFDNDFFAHMEEVDLCWRFHKSGYRVVYIPGSVVYHVGGGMLPYDSSFKTYLNFRNNLFMLYKNLGDEELKSILFIRRILDGIAGIFFLLKGQGSAIKAILKAHSDYRKSLELLNSKREILKNTCNAGCSELILNKSIIYRFYIKGKKTFKSMIV